MPYPLLYVHCMYSWGSQQRLRAVFPHWGNACRNVKWILSSAGWGQNSLFRRSPAGQSQLVSFINRRWESVWFPGKLIAKLFHVFMFFKICNFSVNVNLLLRLGIDLSETLIWWNPTPANLCFCLFKTLNLVCEIYQQQSDFSEESSPY